MSQKRIQDYGSPVVAQSLKSLAGSITSQGILYGNEFIKDASNRMRINPGACVTHQGIIIVESESKVLTIENSSNAADYTVYYSHEDVDISGGVVAELIKESGLLTNGVISGCILGYVRYPGGGIPLDQTHFIQPAYLKIGTLIPTEENAPWIIPIKNQGYCVTYTSGSTVSITDSSSTFQTTPKLYIKLTNNGLTQGVAYLTFPFKVSSSPFAILQMILSTDINAVVTAGFYDSASTLHILGTFTGQSEFLLKTADIPRIAAQTANTIVYLQLQVSLSPTKEARLQAIGLNTYNLPI